jgi:hypothetical protein
VVVITLILSGCRTNPVNGWLEYIPRRDPVGTSLAAKHRMADELRDQKRRAA